MTPVPPGGPRAPEEDSRLEQAFARLKGRYAEARRLGSATTARSNLDWILGVNGGESPENLNRKMIPLLSLWLEDLAVELERGLARGRFGEMDESATSAHGACTRAVASLREATSGFVAALSREA